MNLSSVQFTIVIVCLISPSLATNDNEKLNKPDLEPSLSVQNFGEDEIVLDNILNQIDVQFDLISSFEPPCAQKQLFAFTKLDQKEPEAQTRTTNYLYYCDTQVRKWLMYKYSKYAGIGAIIRRVLNSINDFIVQSYNKDLDLNKILTTEMRTDEHLAIRLRNSWNTCEAAAYGPEATQSSRHAYYFGDGICVHILTPPFDTVEKFMETLLEKFKHLDYVKNFNTFHNAPSLAVYSMQKLCRNWYKTPLQPPQDLSSTILVFEREIESVELAREFIEDNLARMEFSERYHNFQCNWHTVHSIKQTYRALLRLYGHQDFANFKDLLDSSLDRLVLECIALHDGSFNPNHEDIYQLSEEKLSSAVIDQFREALKSYPLPFDQSINSALDIRSASNAFKPFLIKRIKREMSKTGDLTLSKVLNDIFLGDLDNFYSGILKKPLYKKFIEKLEWPDLLFHVFSIRGYKPRVSHALLDFYYLYKIAEICMVIPVEKPKEFEANAASTSGGRIEAP